MKVITANLLNRFWTNGVKPIKTAVGTISSLTTAAKTNLVAAINEVKAKADSNAAAITDVNNNLATHKTSGDHDSRYIKKSGNGTITGNLTVAGTINDSRGNLVGAGTSNSVAIVWSSAMRFDVYVDNTFVGTLTPVK